MEERREKGGRNSLVLVTIRPRSVQIELQRIEGELLCFPSRDSRDYKPIISGFHAFPSLGGLEVVTAEKL